MQKYFFHKWLIGASVLSLALTGGLYAGGLGWVNRMDVTKLRFCA
jgi:hypothetical protein